MWLGYWEVGDTLVGTHQQVDRMQRFLYKPLSCLVDLYHPSGPTRQLSITNQYNAVQFEPVDTLNGWDNTVHPGERFFIGYKLMFAVHT